MRGLIFVTGNTSKDVSNSSKIAAFHIILFYQNFEVFALFCAWYGVFLGVSSTEYQIIQH